MFTGIGTRQDYTSSIVLRKFVCSALLGYFLWIGNSVIAHNGGVNEHGCHTPGGADSGNACHCHPPGKRSPDLPCENGQPVPTNDDESSDTTEESTDDPDPVVLYLGLEVKEEDTCTEYDRDDYTYGPKLDIIKSEELGGIFGIYENSCFATYQDVDIEHLVAIKEAHDSGLCAADPQTKIDFANDLENIVLASSEVNRAKSHYDTAGWLPDNQRCWFAAQVVRVKAKYKLSIDEEEKTALQGVLDECSYKDTVLQIRSDCSLPDSD